MKKDTVYIDIDDEITSITDKLSHAQSSLVALVLPKRCTVLQSSVNMKILKKTADNIDKNIVLITNEASILPLAGMAGIYTARNLQSKPVIPNAVAVEEAIDTISEAEDLPDKPMNPLAAVGELANLPVLPIDTRDVKDEEAPIELGDEPTESAKNDKPSAATAKHKKIRVPSFDKFRKRFLLIAIVIILLVAAWIMAYVVLPKAIVTVTTTNNKTAISLNAIASPTATKVNTTTNTVPSQIKTDTKTESQQFQATGQQNNGNFATGTVTLTDCDPNGNAITVPAGTSITSSSGLAFITQSSVTMPASGFTYISGCTAVNGTSSESVQVAAAEPGDQYNLSGNQSYKVSVPNVMAFAANGMSGGTNNIITIVSQSDCNGAKATLLNSTSNFKHQLSSELSAAGLTPLLGTFNITAGAVSCNPAVGQQATSSTATVQLSYSMMGVNSAGLGQLINAQAMQQIPSSQSVINNGLSTADITAGQPSANGDVPLSLQVNALTGIKQDANLIAKSIVGQKYGDSINTISNMPGVANVTIKYSPFWVSATPKNLKHITVKFINNGS